VIVNTVEQLGVQEAEENDPVDPNGSPLTENETAWLLPETNVVLTVCVVAAPAVTEVTALTALKDVLPAAESEKSKIEIVN
jgi:hypothetical protein